MRNVRRLILMVGCVSVFQATHGMVFDSPAWQNARKLGIEWPADKVHGLHDFGPFPYPTPYSAVQVLLPSNVALLNKQETINELTNEQGYRAMVRYTAVRSVRVCGMPVMSEAVTVEQAYVVPGNACTSPSLGGQDEMYLHLNEIKLIQCLNAPRTNEMRASSFLFTRDAGNDRITESGCARPTSATLLAMTAVMLVMHGIGYL